MKVEH
jgi:hypothetical protein